MAIYIGHGNNADNFRYKKIFFKNILRFSNTPLYIGHGNNAKHNNTTLKVIYEH